MSRTFTCTLRALSPAWGLAWLAAALPCTAASLTPPTLCQASEVIWFSCRVGPGKIASLCASPGTLQYRFGTPQRVELRYPAVASEGHTAFRWAHHDRFQAERTEVTFSNHGVGYTLFDYSEARRREAGVEVGSGRRLRCTDAPQGSLARLKDKLPCDEDSALNLGQCPPAPD